MKKTTLSALLLTSLGFAVLVPQAASAADGTININGKVVAQTCSFAINGGATATTAAVGVVTLPTVTTGSLSTAGALIGAAPFDIAVTLCDPSLASVQPVFSGTGVSASTGGLLNTGTATNVEVQLLNGATQAPMLLNAVTAVAQGSPVGTLTGGATSIPLIARYIATGAATAGTVTSSVNFNMQYQ